jgi:hypothetical protein
MNRTEFVDLKLFYNFYSLHFSVGRVSMIASTSKKRGPKLEALTVPFLAHVQNFVFMFSVHGERCNFSFCAVMNSGEILQLVLVSFIMWS